MGRRSKSVGLTLLALVSLSACRLLDSNKQKSESPTPLDVSDDSPRENDDEKKDSDQNHPKIDDTKVEPPAEIPSSQDLDAQENDDDETVVNVVKQSLTPYIDIGDGKLAYVMDFNSDVVTLYIPSADRYVRISASTGKYIETSLFFADEDCKGNSLVVGFPGQAGKGVVFSLGKYFIAESPISEAFTYKSASSTYPPDCQNLTSILPALAYYYSTTQLDRPFNFEELAPLKIKFD